jgi:C-terminal processing protease CtpA/Prc
MAIFPLIIYLNIKNVKYIEIINFLFIFICLLEFSKSAATSLIIRKIFVNFCKFFNQKCSYAMQRNEENDEGNEERKFNKKYETEYQNSYGCRYSSKNTFDNKNFAHFNNCNNSYYNKITKETNDEMKAGIFGFVKGFGKAIYFKNSSPIKEGIKGGIADLIAHNLKDRKEK